MKVYELQTHDQIDKIADKFPKRLIIIDFWAEWCGPCKEMKPIFAELASEYQDGIFISINIDEDSSGELKKQYGIQSIPMFVFIKDNTVIDYMMGANKSELINKINTNLRIHVQTDPLERIDKTNYQVSPEQNHNPQPVHMQPQQMQTFHTNPYEPIDPSELPPPPPQPQVQLQQRAQQPNSNINGNMSGMNQYTTSNNNPVNLPSDLF